MYFDPEKVRDNARTAATDDLLDRVTVYRSGMEPEAVAVIEEELRQRGVSAAEQADHDERRRRSVLIDADGVALRCGQCRQPAVWQGRVWQRLWG